MGIERRRLAMEFPTLGALALARGSPLASQLPVLPTFLLTSLLRPFLSGRARATCQGPTIITPRARATFRSR